MSTNQTNTAIELLEKERDLLEEILKLKQEIKQLDEPEVELKNELKVNISVELDEELKKTLEELENNFKTKIYDWPKVEPEVKSEREVDFELTDEDIVEFKKSWEDIFKGFPEVEPVNSYPSLYKIPTYDNPLGWETYKVTYGDGCRTTSGGTTSVPYETERMSGRETECSSKGKTTDERRTTSGSGYSPIFSSTEDSFLNKTSIKTTDECKKNCRCNFEFNERIDLE